MKVEIINEECAAIFDELVDGVRNYNFEMISEKSKPLTVTARGQNNELLGGVSGRTIYNQFLVGVVWVDEKTRGTGLGRELMELAEAEAIERGCLASQVDTLSFQAPDFYQKLGYHVVGAITGINESPDRYFLLKKY